MTMMIPLNNPLLILNIVNYVYYLISMLGLYNMLTASLQRGETPSPRSSGYDIKQSDGEAPVMLEFSGMWSTSS